MIKVEAAFGNVGLSDDEHRILCAKFKMSGMQSKSSFLEQLIMAGFAYDVDYSYLMEFGANLNQIAKRVNETRSIYQTDMDDIKREIEKLWKVQKAMLKKQSEMSQ